MSMKSLIKKMVSSYPSFSCLVFSTLSFFLSLFLPSFRPLFLLLHTTHHTTHHITPPSPFSSQVSIQITYIHIYLLPFLLPFLLTFSLPYPIIPYPTTPDHPFLTSLLIHHHHLKFRQHEVGNPLCYHS